jgi:hypothetical protein
MQPHLIHRRSRQSGRRKDARERVDGRLTRVGRVDCTERLLIYRRNRGLRYNTITSYICERPRNVDEEKIGKETLSKDYL